MMTALAYVPQAEVPHRFQTLADTAPNEMEELFQYFNQYYVRGVPPRGRRRAVTPRYPPAKWNQYQAVVSNSHKTNNVSEGWHNRFRVTVAKHHPDLYAALGELQKEQGNTQICLAELSLGRRVKNSPTRKWYTLQDRIRSIVLEFDDYVTNNEEIEYQRNLAHITVLS